VPEQKEILVMEKEMRRSTQIAQRGKKKEETTVSERTGSKAKNAETFAERTESPPFDSRQFDQSL